MVSDPITSPHYLLPPSADRRRRAGALAQHVLLDLAGGGLGDLLEADLARALEVREALAAMRDELFGAGARIRPQLDEGGRCLAPARIRLRDHAAGEDRRMGVEHVLDLDRGDVLAARDDDVLGAILDPDIAVRLEHAEVAGV